MKPEVVVGPNGLTIPAIGLGTWQSAPGLALKAVEHALRAGYRNLDCTFSYTEFHPIFSFTSGNN